LDLIARVAQMKKWSDDGMPKVVWLGGLMYPAAFLNALLMHAFSKSSSFNRSTPSAFESLSFDFAVHGVSEQAIPSVPPTGAYIKGLYLEGAKWDQEAQCLADAGPLDLTCQMPIIHFKPAFVKANDPKKGKLVYPCPMYGTPSRTGTPENPNLIIEVDLRIGLSLSFCSSCSLFFPCSSFFSLLSFLSLR
jgi:dynein heavy chain